MKIEVYRTNEIPKEYWVEIVSGFNASFEGRCSTVEQLKMGFESNCFGYSYHAICFTIEENKIIGFNTVIPNYYLKSNKQKIKVGLSGSTYVLKEYRKEIFIFRDMYNSLMEYCKDEDIIVFLGVPNMNSYNYTIKILKKKVIQTLPYYALPLNVFSVIGKAKFSYLNIISKSLSFIHLLFTYLISNLINTKEKKVKYRILQDEKFLKKRFDNEKYKTKTIGSISFTYVLYDEDNIKTIYLMHFSERDVRSFRSLTRALLYIYNNESFDLILFVGTMNLKQFVLLKVPQKFEPRSLPLTYSILDVYNKEDFEDMGIKENWDFSLINLDVR